MSNHDWDIGFDDGIERGRKEREAEILKLIEDYPNDKAEWYRYYIKTKDLIKQIKEEQNK